MLRLRTPDCVGVELIGNRLYGGARVVYEGPPELAVDRDNRSFPAVGTDLPSRPTPRTASIYAWQNKGRDR